MSWRFSIGAVKDWSCGVGEAGRYTIFVSGQHCCLLRGSSADVDAHSAICQMYAASSTLYVKRFLARVFIQGLQR